LSSDYERHFPYDSGLIEVATYSIKHKRGASEEAGGGDQN